VTPTSDDRTKNVFIWGNKELSSAVYFDGNKIVHQQI